MLNVLIKIIINNANVVMKVSTLVIMVNILLNKIACLGSQQDKQIDVLCVIKTLELERKAGVNIY